MSRSKSNSQKKKTQEIWCVDVYEHEKDGGQRLEDHFEFPSEEDASAYVRKANVEFSKHGSSDCFAMAHPPYKKGTK